MKAQALIDKVRGLSAPSPTARRLLERLNDPEIESEDIIQIIKQDGVMSAKLLSICNSAAMGVSEPISSVEHAVFYLGQSRVFQLAVSLGLGGQLSPGLPAYAIGDKELWAHSLLTAFLMQPALEALPEVEIAPAVAYTAGLMHDIGKVVLNQILDQTTRAAIQNLVEQGTHCLCESEVAVIGVDHAEVGACLLAKWNLPETIVEAVGHHHAPITKPLPLLSSAVYLANSIAHQAGPSTGWGSLSTKADDATAEQLGVERSDAETLLIKALQAMEEVQKIQAAA